MVRRYILARCRLRGRLNLTLTYLGILSPLAFFQLVSVWSLVAWCRGFHICHEEIHVQHIGSRRDLLQTKTSGDFLKISCRLDTAECFLWLAGLQWLWGFLTAPNSCLLCMCDAFPTVCSLGDDLIGSSCSYGSSFFSQLLPKPWTCRTLDRVKLAIQPIQATCLAISGEQYI